jgi:hypothetical protein
MPEVDAWLVSIGLQSYTAAFNDAGYQELDYIASLSADDAQIVAEEELFLEPPDIEIFLKHYAACPSFVPAAEPVVTEVEPTEIQSPEDALKTACAHRDLELLGNAITVAMRSGIPRTSPLMTEASQLQESLLRENELVEMLANPDHPNAYGVEQMIADLEALGVGSKHNVAIRTARQLIAHQQESPTVVRKQTAMACQAENCKELHRYADGYCHNHRQGSPVASAAPSKAALTKAPLTDNPATASEGLGSFLSSNQQAAPAVVTTSPAASGSCKGLGGFLSTKQQHQAPAPAPRPAPAPAPSPSPTLGGFLSTLPPAPAPAPGPKATLGSFLSAMPPAPAPAPAPVVTTAATVAPTSVQAKVEAAAAAAAAAAPPPAAAPAAEKGQGQGRQGTGGVGQTFDDIVEADVLIEGACRGAWEDVLADTTASAGSPNWCLFGYSKDGKSMAKVSLAGKGTGGMHEMVAAMVPGALHFAGFRVIGRD